MKNNLTTAITFAVAVYCLFVLGMITNSVSTIFTMDLYRTNEKVDDKSLVNVGRLAGYAGLITSIVIAPIFLGNLESAFQYVQEYMGLFSPVILFVFLSAIFFKKSNSKSVLSGSLVALVVGVVMKLYVAQTDQSLFEPFMHQMAISFGIAFLVSFALSDKSDNTKVFKLSYEDFKTSKLFNYGSITVLLILSGIYGYYW